MDELSILRARDRRDMAWKNGGGRTSEVIVSPPDANFDTFDWRISIATVSADGPFSDLPGVDRRLVLLEGSLLLTISGRSAVELTPTSPPFELAGEWQTYAELAGGPATDLNVMTRRGRYRATLERRTLSGPVTVHNTEECTLLIATEMVNVEYEGTQHKLQPCDAVLLRGESAAGLSPWAAPSLFYVIEISPDHPPAAR